MRVGHIGKTAEQRKKICLQSRERRGGDENVKRSSAIFCFPCIGISLSGLSRKGACYV